MEVFHTIQGTGASEAEAEPEQQYGTRCSGSGFINRFGG